ncbi:MAG: redoxin domain-containing protein [Thermoleophilaceae bacterium]|nr:redoxin domain-containing protein [Thermoleophilaceae bacterium]
MVDRPTVLVIPRYYGCLPCRDYLRRMSERLHEVEARGGAVLGVSVGADYRARWLMEEKGVRFPLLVDLDRPVYRALELPRRWWVALNPRGWWNYGRALARGNRQGPHHRAQPVARPGHTRRGRSGSVGPRRPRPRRLPEHRAGARRARAGGRAPSRRGAFAAGVSQARSPSLTATTCRTAQRQRAGGVTLR